LISTPAEQNFSEIEGVKHVYSVSQPGMAILTVQFRVGEDRTAAILRLYDKVFSNQDWLPPGLGVGQPLVKPKGIDDVPIVTLTLWSDDPHMTNLAMQNIAHTVEAELKRVKGTRDIFTISACERVVHVLLDATKLAGYNLSVDALRQALQGWNTSRDTGTLVNHNQEILLKTGVYFSSAESMRGLVVGMHDGMPVYLEDVAQVRETADQPERYVWFGSGPQMAEKGITQAGEFPAVTIAVAKQPGTNAVEIAKQVIASFNNMRGVFVPDDVQVTVTRNYGQTAQAKAQKLIGKLIFATAFVVLLVLFVLGWREAFIVGLAVVITLLLTLFASWAWGFTLNRVSLFALIFSIGILVDDAIVVVENIHRHIHQGAQSLLEAIPLAVEEVGGPTILATFTVIAALLPMAFVTGLMGPYMSPIPINASTGMLISLVVAFVFTPWLSYKVLGRKFAKTHPVAHLPASADTPTQPGFSYRLFNATVRPFLVNTLLRWGLMITVLVLISLSIGLIYTQNVVLKMLPFDNKSEFQVVVDMPEGTTLEETDRLLRDLAAYVAQVPEVTDYQIYTGTAGPINFNGLVRQYYLRQGSNVGDLQINLIDYHHRKRSSHEIAQAMREPLQKIGKPYNANVKIVEVPPGPPVLSPLVAEVYGVDYGGQIQLARSIHHTFLQSADIVDSDMSVEHPAPRWTLHIDQAKAASLGVSQASVVQTVQSVMSGEDVTYLRNTYTKYPIPVRLEFATQDKADLDKLLDLRLPSRNGVLVPLSEFVRVVKGEREATIYHKDLLPVVYITADMAGKLDSPLYGMFQLFQQLQKMQLSDGEPLTQHLVAQPEDIYRYSIKWDGEWQITYETFRDMGIAYLVGMILIYLLVVAQFRSYSIPLVIMAPIPFTLIGVMPGHALMGEQFTATSMIGMLALAGIIVRNSILLVDFINQEVARGKNFQDAVVNSSAVRAAPIVLTGLAAMLGALFILDDPIFSGLAISLIFGIFVSTLLTLVVIPVLYYAVMRKTLEKG